MDKIISELLKPAYEAVSGMHPVWQLALVVIVIIITQGQKLLGLRARWYDYRLNRNRLQYEKERLEALKLHYEIEAIKKKNELSTDAYENELMQENAKPAFNLKYPHIPKVLIKIEQHIKKKKLWGWLERNPLVGKIIINTVYVLITASTYFITFATISLIVISYTVEVIRTDLGFWGILLTNLFYILITSVFFYWKALFAHYRTLVGLKKSGVDTEEISI